MIHFVGAGSGAVDLITVRGQKLLEEADIVVYAGSLVNPELLKNCQKDCQIYNSANQTIGRAARNSEGHVIMYADTMTESMQLAIDETQRRREIQMQYNKEHGITPKTIQKSVRDLISISKKVAAEELKMEKDPESMSRKELEKLVRDLEKQMKKAAAELNFEVAAELRDKLIDLKKMLNDMDK